MKMMRGKKTRSRREQSSPRVSVHKDDRVTVAGLGYHALRGIVSAATINYYQDLKALNERTGRWAELHGSEVNRAESLMYVKTMLAVLKLLEESLTSAKRTAIYGAPANLTKEERLKAVREERKERILIESLLEGMTR